MSADGSVVVGKDGLDYRWTATGGRVTMTNIDVEQATLNAPAAGGVGSVSINIPHNSGLVGKSFYLHAVVSGASQPGGLAFSNGVKLTIRQ